jgi:hypothetical protein
MPADSVELGEEALIEAAYLSVERKGMCFTTIQIFVGLL